MRTLVFLVLTLVLPLSAVAQEEPQTPVSEGDRVRISRDGDELTGRVEAISAEAITLRTDEARESVVTVARLEITDLAISRGERSRGRGAWHKAKWGALLGASSGAILTALQHDQVGEDGASVGEAAALGAWSGGLFGGLIGALIGTLNPGERWDAVSPTFELRTSKVGFSFSATISF